MALSNSYLQCYKQIADFFASLTKGQAPDQFTVQYLKDLGFTSSTHRAFIPLLKSLGFLTPEGTPTARYHQYRDRSQSKRIMGEALLESYSDLFQIRSHPTEQDRDLIVGKFKSTHNTSDNVADLMATTFYSLLEIADVTRRKEEPEQKPADPIKDQKPEKADDSKRGKADLSAGLHYNIQIHLPATKDIEVYNAIFKSLKEHLLE